MKLHNLFETLSVYKDQLSLSDIWQVLDQLSDQDSLEISEWLYHNNTGIAANVVEQIQGIHFWYRQHQKFMTDTQKRWLLINTLENWDKLTLAGRKHII